MILNEPHSHLRSNFGDKVKKYINIRNLHKRYIHCILFCILKYRRKFFTRLQISLSFIVYTIVKQALNNET